MMLDRIDLVGFASQIVRLERPSRLDRFALVVCQNTKAAALRSV